MSESAPVEVRLQTASDPAEAFRRYDELRRSKLVKRALIVAELKSGSFWVLGQMANPNSMAQLCFVATEALGGLPAELRERPSGDAIVVDNTELPPIASGKLFLSIAAAWAEVEQSFDTFDPKIGAAQRRAMRQAFYLGASVLFHRIDTLLDQGDDGTEAGIAKMNDLRGELSRVALELASGRA